MYFISNFYSSAKASHSCHQGYKYSSDKVVVDGSLITSRGPGTSFDFALAVLEKLQGGETRKKVAEGMLL